MGLRGTIVFLLGWSFVAVCTCLCVSVCLCACTHGHVHCFFQCRGHTTKDSWGKVIIADVSFSLYHLVLHFLKILPTNSSWAFWPHSSKLLLSFPMDCFFTPAPPDACSGDELGCFMGLAGSLCTTGSLGTKKDTCASLSECCMFTCWQEMRWKLPWEEHSCSDGLRIMRRAQTFRKGDYAKGPLSWWWRCTFGFWL